MVPPALFACQDNFLTRPILLLWIPAVYVHRLQRAMQCLQPHTSRSQQRTNCIKMFLVICKHEPMFLSAATRYGNPFNHPMMALSKYLVARPNILYLNWITTTKTQRHNRSPQNCAHLDIMLMTHILFPLHPRTALSLQLNPLLVSVLNNSPHICVHLTVLYLAFKLLSKFIWITLIYMYSCDRNDKKYIQTAHFPLVISGHLWYLCVIIIL